LQALAYKAYGEATQRTAGEREIEQALFRQITDALVYVSEAQNVQPSVWADAIYRNQKLWASLSVDLLNPGNALAPEIKQSLLHLADFVRLTSLKILGGDGEISDLIEINQTIMMGLAGSVGENQAKETA